LNEISTIIRHIDSLLKVVNHTTCILPHRLLSNISATYHNDITTLAEIPLIILPKTSGRFF